MPTQADQLAEVTAVINAQAAQRRQVEAAAVASALILLGQFTAWYDTAAITVWAKRMAELVETHQRLTTTLTNAYLVRIAELVSGRRVPAPKLVDVSKLRTGVTHPGVYGRVADTWRYQTWKLEKAGLPGSGAVPTAEPAPEPVPTPAADPERAQGGSTGGSRLVSADKAAGNVLRESIVEDIAQADRAQAHEFLTKASPRITNYRRVIHPELAESKLTCGLCAAAATRLYHVAELMPIHTNCHCGIVPIYGGIDPGALLNNDDLKLLYKVAGSTGRADLSKVRYRVEEDPETGPRLVAVLGAQNQRRKPAQDTKPRKSPTRKGPQAVVGDFGKTATADRVTAR